MVGTDLVSGNQAPLEVVDLGFFLFFFSKFDLNFEKCFVKEILKRGLILSGKYLSNQVATVLNFDFGFSSFC